ncbi:LAFA_0F07294g1_1 [Lachancea sp. 'fantastica']|nr:LAFA_0F07294g1_1 [Lachancea sp. 'fantastica']
MNSSDRILPEEYRVNSQMINKLIKQNKDLTLQLDRKQDEIDRMNVLIGSLRGKLIKYTELNKKLNQNVNLGANNGNSTPAESMHQSPSFSPVDFLQVNKTRAKDPTVSAARASQLESRIGDIYSKLDALTTLMTNSMGGGPAQTSSETDSRQARTRPNSSSTSTADSVLHRTMRMASEDDIITQESAELQNLEGQIDLLKRKLLIKRENELRKLSLNKELLDLMEKLDMSKPTLPTPDTAVDATPPHCEQCHTSATTAQNAKNARSVSHHNHHQNFQNSTASRNPPYMSMAQALETPTPAHRAPKSNEPLW